LDFLTTHAAPVVVTIDGAEYTVPRFLNRALKEWAALLAKEQRDIATADMDPEQKARFLRFWTDPALDVAEMIRRSTSPAGVDYVVNCQLKKAGVPDAVRETLLDTADPMLLRQLAEELTYSGQTMAKLSAEATPNPLASPASESAGSPETGEPTGHDSPMSTAAA
jgi:hypothetical protein